MNNLKKTNLFIGGKEYTSRFFLGTGKFKDKQEMLKAIISSKAQIVTVALRRIDVDKNEENILSYIPKDITLMTNTSGARNAKEAVRIAYMAREAGYGNLIKIEIVNDSKYLLPDNYETIKATQILSSDGFVVLPYMHPDLYVARELVKSGAAAIMPLGSLIGSNQGLEMEMMIKILIDEINEVPVIVDAGIGRPSHAAYAMEIGVDAVLVNTAVATSENPPLMAESFVKAIEAGRSAYIAKMGNVLGVAEASSPLSGFLYDS